MGCKLDNQQKTESPGAAAHTLPSTIGTGHLAYKAAPAYTMSPLWKDIKGNTVSPGPAAYQTSHYVQVTNKKAPSYSLGARLEPAKPTTKVPGPGAYTPTESFVKRSAEKFSMRVRQSPYMLIAYDLDPK
eukprot:Colp12_sorted_trinity150504_noHs@26053